MERQRILSELRKIAYASDQDQLLMQLTVNDRLKALLLLGKAQGMFWEKPEIAEEATWVKKIKQAMIALQEEKAKGKYPEINF